MALTACPTLEQLDEALATSPVNAAILEHLHQCTRCRELASTVQSNHGVLLNLREVDSKRLTAALVEARVGTERPELSSEDIPGYRLESNQPLRQGGQGRVYIARRISDSAVVAIKVIGMGPFATHRQRSQFEREIALTLELKHPHIVQLLEAGMTAAGHRYYVMPRIDGLPLDQFARTRPLTLAEMLLMFSKVCDAVRFAHRRRIIHCDLKPGNILVDPEGQPQVLDFGLAAFLGANQRLNTRNASIPGEFMGTIAYAAPEQVDWTFGPLDRRTDVYALGFILYHLLTSRPPYPIAGSNSEIVEHILHTRPEKPSRYRDDIGHELDALVLTALLKAPQRRYPSAEEMHQAVQRVLESPTLGQVRKPSAPWYSLTGRLTRFKPPPPPAPPPAGRE